MSLWSVLCRARKNSISAEELRVSALLKEFVTDEVSERIDERRKKVADIWGTGTTKSQESEVREFYREVKALLTEALEQHLRGRAADFEWLSCN